MKPSLLRILASVSILSAAGLIAEVSAAQTAPAAMATAPAAGPFDFADVVERTAPAVVNIRTAARLAVPSQSPQGPDGEDSDNFNDFFHRFFPQPGPGQRPMPMPTPRGPHIDREIPRGVGSGFLISSDGYILTNHHVVDGADDITVTLPDKREFKGKLVGSDQRTDVALVKVEATDLPVLRLGDPAKLRVGEWVIAIGSPFSLQNTVTAGIVSAKSRETGELLPFIQTDAAVNPGNSGGPLINMRGEVVGINSQIFTTSGSYAGISFAIPIDEAQKVAKVLRAQGKVVRGKIGVLIKDVSREVADAIGLQKAVGAEVSSVETDGPADKAGVQAGDVILRFDGKAVEGSADLRRLVASTNPGAKSVVTVWRAGAPHDLQVTIAEMPQDNGRAPHAPRPGKAAPEAHPDALGLVVSDPGADAPREVRDGAVVVESADGLAVAAGIRPGDMILRVGDAKVKNSKNFKELVAKLDLTKPVPLLVRRGDQTQWLVLRKGEN
jgi:serine protease Do